ncbi:MAG: homoserine O-succinyltransferase [Pseudomonadota bacterium]
MPITLPATLPAFDILKDEGVMVMSEELAARQDIRPLRIALLNLMPNKIVTETQIARLVGATPLQVELTLVRMTDHVSKNTAPTHMEAFYRPFAAIAGEKYDGLIITGAPIELLAFEEVGYWRELTRVFAWTETHVHASLAICWGAQAMLYHFHGVPKYALPAKAFGCFRHRNCDPSNPYLRGFSDDFTVPVSRWTETRAADLPAGSGLKILMQSPETGPCLVEDPGRRALYMFNHVEYDTASLQTEYERDVAKGSPIGVPANYYPDDDPSRPPENRWRSHAHLLFGNWINQIYQTTPFDMRSIGEPGAPGAAGAPTADGRATAARG